MEKGSWHKVLPLTRSYLEFVLGRGEAVFFNEVNTPDHASCSGVADQHKVDSMDCFCMCSFLFVFEREKEHEVWCMGVWEEDLGEVWGLYLIHIS